MFRCPFCLILALCCPILTQLTEQGKLVGTGYSSSTNKIYQGQAVSLSSDGNTLAVGGPYDDDLNIGAVWIFTRNGGTWTQQGSKLVGTGYSGSPVYQGTSVSLSSDGNTLAVGGGGSWIFTRSNGSWSQQGTQLIFGSAVALSSDGNTLAVGNPRDSGGIGAVWIFTRSNGTWMQQGSKLVGTGSNGTIALQGSSLALSSDGNTLAVGGPNDGAANLTGCTLFCIATSYGAVWIFTRSGGIWTQQGSKLVGNGTIPFNFWTSQGYSVSLSSDGNTLAFGAPKDNYTVGAIWIFTRSGGIWTQESKLIGGQNGTEPVEPLGTSVSLTSDGNSLWAGVTDATFGVGGVSYFSRTGGSWVQGSKLVGSGAGGLSGQGSSVCLSSDSSTLAVGGNTDSGSVGATWIFTNIPTSEPTLAPTFAPSSAPVEIAMPTASPTIAPSAPLAATPTFVPSIAPAESALPTASPIAPTLLPTSAPILVQICGNGLLESPEECDDGNAGSGDGCGECFVEYGWNCDISVIPTNCSFCYGAWHPVSLGVSTFCSSCQNGTMAVVRVVSEFNCPNLPAASILPCSFPCLPPTSESGDDILPALTNNSYLKFVLNQLGITTNFETYDYDQNTAAISFIPCPSGLNLSYADSIISELVADIFHGQEFPVTRNENNCTVYIGKSKKGMSPLIALIVLILIPILLVAMLILYAIYSYYRSPLHSLPPDISWSFLNKLHRPWLWSRKEDYYMRDYFEGSAEWNRVYALGLGELSISRLSALYNPSLAVSFVNHFKLLLVRKLDNQELFFAGSDYKGDQGKEWIMKQYDELCSRFGWNLDLTIPILPGFHGTEYYIAEKIAQTGFCALSSLDDGYFGKGIYFTCDILYSLSYLSVKRNPAVIISYLLPGNVFPVNEDHIGEHSLRGTALKPGYNSHFVVTDKTGSVYSQSDATRGTQYTEIAIGQEPQLLPAFILTLERESCKAQFQEWHGEAQVDSGRTEFVEISMSTDPHSSLLSLNSTIIDGVL